MTLLGDSIAFMCVRGSVIFNIVDCTTCCNCRCQVIAWKKHKTDCKSLGERQDKLFAVLDGMLKSCKDDQHERPFMPLPGRLAKKLIVNGLAKTLIQGQIEAFKEVSKLSPRSTIFDDRLTSLNDPTKKANISVIDDLVALQHKIESEIKETFSAERWSTWEEIFGKVCAHLRVDSLEVGTRVRVHRLIKAERWNGCQGAFQGMVNEGDNLRVRVILDGKKELSLARECRAACSHFKRG